ncbi:MAG: tRNA-dihydrouridine(16) synthase [Chlamydiia bacterium]|nr:tRNA-dihydrouridine(16) synthase [Chlamydiia bacterium]MCH9616019.1 tRNA-dihydrouridine(16) synthase [Chlamydiia bacterium]MCH9629042.1 tRNA-dihydrouridine(16) synthase [Chlamydiia bacterium]
MEGVGSTAYRRAISLIGGFDEACTEFLRVPKHANCKALAKHYDPHVTAPIPQAAQIMGSEPLLLAEMASELEERGAPRIDLNCGCPSKKVNGKGAGASLLLEPQLLHDCLKAMVEAVSIPVTAKLRSGYNDSGLFEENILSASSSGIKFLTLHPRTKLEGYKPPCHWHLIKKAKEIGKIPVVGSGDVTTPALALKMLEETGCDGIMVGRGALMNPWIFHEIRQMLENIPCEISWETTRRYFENFVESVGEKAVSQMKQLFNFMFQRPELLPYRREMLRGTYSSSSDVFLKNMHVIEKLYG